MNFETARTQMLGQQIRAWEVLNERVLNVLRNTPRERFVPAGYEDLAFADTEVPIGHGQSMMEPKVEGRLLQALNLESADDVLEIGTGSGYLSSCLAKLGANVTSVDIYPDFTESAEERLRAQRISNVELCVVDALKMTYSNQFDVIVVTASVPDLTDHFIEMLRPDGRMFIVVGRAPVMEARLITRFAGGDWTDDCLFETQLTPMVNIDSSEPFEL